MPKKRRTSLNYETTNYTRKVHRRKKDVDIAYTAKKLKRRVTELQQWEERERRRERCQKAGRAILNSISTNNKTEDVNDAKSSSSVEAPAFEAKNDSKQPDEETVTFIQEDFEEKVDQLEDFKPLEYPNLKATKKKILTNFEFLKSQIPFPITAAELQNVIELVGDENAFARASKETKPHCTVCDKHLGVAPITVFDRYIHPVLNTLLCEICYNFFYTGDFVKDYDGSEIYCKWCAQGGTVMCCSECPLVFCKDCVKLNLGAKRLGEIEKADHWECFKCQPVQLEKLRIIVTAAHEYTVKLMSQAIAANDETLLERDISACCKAELLPPTPEQKLLYDEEDDIADEESPMPLANISIPSSTSSADDTKSCVQSSGVELLNKALDDFCASEASPPVMFQKIRAIPTALLQDPTKKQAMPTSPTRVFRRILPAQNAVGNGSSARATSTLRNLPPAANRKLVSPVTRVLAPSSTPPPLALATSLQVNASGSLRGPPPLRPAVALHRGSPSSASVRPQKIVRKRVSRSGWLKHAIRTSVDGVNNYLQRCRQLDKVDLEGYVNHSQLADLHNQMQHVMSHCTNMLIETRKRMHRDFLDYLSRANISHASVGRPLLSNSNNPITAPTLIKTVSPACSASVDTVASAPPAGTTTKKITKPIAIAPAPPKVIQAAKSTASNQLIINQFANKPNSSANMLLNTQLSSQQTGTIIFAPKQLQQKPGSIILRPAKPPIGLKPLSTILSPTPVRGFKPVKLSTLKPGTIISKNLIVQNNTITKVLPAASSLARAKGTGRLPATLKQIKPPVSTFPPAPVCEVKDPLALSDDEEESSMLQSEDLPKKNVSNQALGLEIKAEVDT